MLEGWIAMEYIAVYIICMIIAAERQRSSLLIWKFYSTQSFRVSI